MTKPIILLPFVLSGHKGAAGPTRHLPDTAFSDNFFPENSMASIKKAISLGAEIIEADAQLTKDKKIVISHRDNLNEALYPRDDSIDYGSISEHTLEELQTYDIGGGHKILSFKEILDFATAENTERRKKNIPDIQIVANVLNDEITHVFFDEISPYLDQKKLAPENFIFGASEIGWKKLCKIKAFNPKFEVVPIVLTKGLFGEENVDPLTYAVKENTPYKEETLQRIKEFHENIPGGCYAVQIIMSDIKKPFLDFCAEINIGLSTVSLKETDNHEKSFRLMGEYLTKLPLINFESGNIPQTKKIISKTQKREM